MSFLDIDWPRPIISQQIHHETVPERGPTIRDYKGERKTRIVVGWRHQDDNPEAMRSGRLWCEVYNNSFHVYDEHYNRSPQAGVVRFCGHANFTMVRMFHPWFAMYDGRVVPQDMDSGDKQWCRERYEEALLRYQTEDEAREEAAGDDDDDMSDQNRKKAKSAAAKVRRPYFRRGRSNSESDESDSSSGSESDGSDGESSDDVNVDGEEVAEEVNEGNVEMGGANDNNTTNDETNDEENSNSNSHDDHQAAQRINHQSPSGSSTGAESLHGSPNNEKTNVIKLEPCDFNTLATDNSDGNERNQNSAILMTALQSFNNDESRSTSNVGRDGSSNPSDEQDEDEDTLFIPDPEQMEFESTLSVASSTVDDESIKIEDPDTVETVDITGDPVGAAELLQLYLRGSVSFPIEID